MTRTEALCRALGWQGGTIHQLSTETGCKIDDLLYAEPKSTNLSSDYTGGWFAVRTCSLDFNLKTNFPKKKGNLEFWLGVIQGMLLGETLGDKLPIR